MIDQIKTIVNDVLANRNMMPVPDSNWYDPQAWKQRGESYCNGALCVVIHEEGEYCPVFSFDACVMPYDYKLLNEMAEALQKIGVYSEQGTTWYSGFYRIWGE